MIQKNDSKISDYLENDMSLSVPTPIYWETIVCNSEECREEENMILFLRIS